MDVDNPDEAGGALRPTTGAPAIATLTPRERSVLELVARGLTDHAVAHRLAIADGTVRKHLEHVYRKLGVTNRVTASMLWLARPGSR